MSEAVELLDLIEQAIVAHGGDLGGWTRRADDTLQLFDGRVTLRAIVHDADPKHAGAAHVHVLATLHECDDETLDACLFGIGEDRAAAIRETTVLWLTCVAGPIKSFLDGKPVCMTCQAGVADGDAAAGYVQGDYGLPGLRAYVGPGVARAIADQRIVAAIDESKPWFLYAAETAAPRRVHLAKATIASHGKQGWQRDLEIDGHEVSHHDPNWPAGVAGPDFGYLTRFAVFEFPRNSTAIQRRAELDRTIRGFAQQYAAHENVDRLMESLVEQGFDADLVHEVESLSTIAFGRALFERAGVQYSQTVIRAMRDGRVEMDVPLMSLPAYSRARALTAELHAKLGEEGFQALALYNAESHAILQAMDAAGDKCDLSKLSMLPCVVPDRGVSKETMDAAVQALNDLIARRRAAAVKKPWWKLW